MGFLCNNLIFFSVDPTSSILRTVGFKIYIFVFAIKYILEIKENYYFEKFLKFGL